MPAAIASTRARWVATASAASGAPVPTSTASAGMKAARQPSAAIPAASTLRRTLAALLLDELALTPTAARTKVTLPRDQNTRLSAWQQRHLRLTWHPCARPWELEAAIIERLAPPLNLASNAAHPFHATLAAARQRLRQAAC